MQQFIEDLEVEPIDFDFGEVGGEDLFGEIDLSFFSDDEVGIMDTRYVKPPNPKSVKQKNVTYKNAESLAKDTNLDKDSRTFAVVDGTFIFGDYIEALCVERNLHIKKMFIHTLSMSENNVDSLANLIKGDFVQKLDLLISAYFFSNERHDLVKYIYQELDIDNKFQLGVARSHTKMCGFETFDGMKYIIHGSANLRSSANLEQFVIEQCDEIYDFMEDVSDNIMDKYKTINIDSPKHKQLKRKEIWQAVVKAKK
jgi:hypothetical protein